MCSFKECPIYDKCEHEIEQVLYCRHVEMIKKIAKMRRALKRRPKNSLMATKSAATNGPILTALALAKTGNETI